MRLSFRSPDSVMPVIRVIPKYRDPMAMMTGPGYAAGFLLYTLQYPVQNRDELRFHISRKTLSLNSYNSLLHPWHQPLQYVSSLSSCNRDHLLTSNQNSSLSDHRNRGPAIIAVDVSLAALASIVVLTRLYTRAFVTKFIGQDDWWMLVAWV